jgi:hypothetical protein
MDVAKVAGLIQRRSPAPGAAQKYAALTAPVERHGENGGARPRDICHKRPAIALLPEPGSPESTKYGAASALLSQVSMTSKSHSRPVKSDVARATYASKSTA